METKKERIYIRVTEKQKVKLQEMAKADNRSLSNYILTVVESHIEGGKKMKRYFITNNAYREIVFAKGSKGFVFDSPDGVFEGVDLYQEPAEVLSQLKKLGIDDSNFGDLCRTFPNQVIEISKEFFNSNTVYEF